MIQHDHHHGRVWRSRALQSNRDGRVTYTGKIEGQVPFKKAGWLPMLGGIGGHEPSNPIEMGGLPMLGGL